MLLPNRSGSSDSYRYGFQGQEKDDEVKGEGNSVNYKFRMHDPRVGRFFAVDPLASKYPYYSPYQFSGNKVIHALELEGLEQKIVIKSPYVRDAVIKYTNSGDIFKAVGAARNAYIWEDQSQIDHAKQSFNVGQKVGEPSVISSRENEFNEKGAIVYSYNNEGEQIELMTISIQSITNKNPELSWLEEIAVWINEKFPSDNSSGDKSSYTSQGGYQFVVKGGASGLVRPQGNPSQIIDITEIYAIAMNQAGGSTNSVMDRVYAANKAIEIGESIIRAKIVKNDGSGVLRETRGGIIVIRKADTVFIGSEEDIKKIDSINENRTLKIHIDDRDKK